VTARTSERTSLSSCQCPCWPSAHWSERSCWVVDTHRRLQHHQLARPCHNIQQIYTASQKNTTLVIDNFRKCWPIFKKSLDLAINLQQAPCKIQKDKNYTSSTITLVYFWCSQNQETKSWLICARVELNAQNVIHWHECISRLHHSWTASLITLLQTTPDIHAASVHQHHELSSSIKLLLHFHPQFFSQPGLDLDCWGPQVWWNESGCLPFQKADCLTGSSYLSQQGFCCKFAAESISERIFNIGQHLPELCLGQKRRQLVTLPNKKCLFVKMHPV